MNFMKAVSLHEVHVHLIEAVWMNCVARQEVQGDLPAMLLCVLVACSTRESPVPK